MADQGQRGVQDQLFVLVTGANRYVRSVCLLRLDRTQHSPDHVVTPIGTDIEFKVASDSPFVAD